MSQPQKKKAELSGETKFIALIGLRVAMMVGVFAVAVVIILILIATAEQPNKAQRPERAIRVELTPATFEDVPVTISGFGEVRARDVVEIAPEVSGRIVEVHPRLEVGERIDAGELLFQIDPRDYEARVAEAEATVAQLESTVAALRRQFAIDKDRLLTFQRSERVAFGEYDRVRTLYSVDQVGTQSNVDQSEMAYNSTKDAADQLSQAVDLYPMRIQEAESALKSAHARLDLARASLERTRVIAPFDARLKRVALEAGQIVAPGTPVLTLADDSLLEISVSLNSKVAGSWLQFETSREVPDASWFGQASQVPVDVYWTENETEHWVGQLHRVEVYDQETRTISVAVRISGANVLSDSDLHIPLVEGMFCRVVIPGKTAHDVLRVPVEAVAFDREADGTRTAYIARPDANGDLRLHSVSVREKYLDSDYVYVQGDIEPDDLVVGTRLVNPLELSLLEATNDVNVSTAKNVE